MKRLLVAVLIAVLVLGGAYYVFVHSHPAEPPAAKPPDLLALLPATATTVAYADGQALRASPFITELLQHFPPPAQDSDYVDFVKATGFDYTRDLDRVAVARFPDGDRITTVAVAEGRFDRQKIAAYAQRSGKISKQAAFDVYSFTSGQPPKTIQFTFLSNARIAMTDGANLASLFAIRPAASGEAQPPAGLDAAMQERVARVAASALFSVTKIPPYGSKGKERDWIADYFSDTARSVQWVSFAALPQDDRMHVAAEAECDTAGNARQLSWTLDGLKLMGRMAVSDSKARREMDPQATVLVETLLREGKITRNDRAVRFSVMLTPAFLEQMKKAAGASGRAK